MAILNKIKIYVAIELATHNLLKCPNIILVLVWSRVDITAVKSLGQNFNTCFVEKHSMTCASPVNSYFMG